MTEIKRFPRPMRFPREQAQHRGRKGHSFSMNTVWETVEAIAAGKEVTPQCRVLVQRWFGIEHMTQVFANQCLCSTFDGNFRMPRED